MANKAPREIRAFLQGVMSEAFQAPAFKQNLVRAIVELQLDPRTLALILAYAYGRPPLLDDVTHRGGYTLEEIVSGKRRDEDENEDDEPDPTTH